MHSTPIKEAILIGGLPCSGKTTLATRKYSDYYLIDDPTNFVENVEPHMNRDRIVITDPHFSFKGTRELVKGILEKHGYVVTVEVLVVDKDTLFRRASKRSGKECIDFILNFNVEL